MELFPNLSGAEIAGAKLDAARLLKSNGFFSNLFTSLGYVEVALLDFENEAYRRRFSIIYGKLSDSKPKPGTALSKAFNGMTLKRSVFIFIKTRDYQNSTLKNAVSNAFKTFASSDPNTKTTF